MHRQPQLRCIRSERATESVDPQDIQLAQRLLKQYVEWVSQQPRWSTKRSLDFLEKLTFGMDKRVTLLILEQIRLEHPKTRNGNQPAMAGSNA